ncbi:hypothetical protein [Hahella ganghwensis]|uniref:hypothetical protein n=1 Tax=Hahella ganghwensis TaxID=286420 RepID=UPI0003A8E038|nr:hypothetical protein [Hahella ganghwensis]
MMIIEYTALRSLTSGTSENDFKSITIPLAEFQPRPRSIVSTAFNKKQTLSKSLRHGSYIEFQCRSVPTDDIDQIFQLAEFFASIDGGETFSIVSLESKWTNVTLPQTAMLSNGYTPDPRNYQLLSYSFSIRFI